MQEIIENICDQISRCFAYIKLFSIKEYGNREYRLLKLELQHFDLLLDLLESKISIETYVKGYSLLFANEKFYDDPNVYPPFSLIKESDIDIICIDKKDLCFINVLKICNENIKKHISSKSYEKISDEIYYSHNVPGLIHTDYKSAIKYFLSVECTECRRRCSKEMVASYEDAWEQVRKQFLNDIDS